MAEVWTDSNFATAEHQRVLDDTECFHPDLGNAMGQATPSKLRLRKVKSHQQLESLSGMKLWFAVGNTFTDLAAKSALKSDFGFLQDFQNEIASAEAEQKASLHLFQKYLLDLSSAEWTLKQQANMGLALAAENLPGDEQTTQRNEAWLEQCPAETSTWPIPVLDEQCALACSWPPFFTVPLWNWLRQLRWQSTPCATQGVTGLELLVDYVLVTGCCPPGRETQDGSYVDMHDRNQCHPITQRALGPSYLGMHTTAIALVWH